MRSCARGPRISRVMAHGRGTLLLHVLDLVDEEQWSRLIKDRYERLLMEIFE